MIRILCSAWREVNALVLIYLDIHRDLFKEVVLGGVIDAVQLFEHHELTGSAVSHLVHVAEETSTQEFTLMMDSMLKGFAKQFGTDSNKFIRARPLHRNRILSFNISFEIIFQILSK